MRFHIFEEVNFHQSKERKVLDDKKIPEKVNNFW
jgi:hypothetical protein